MLDEFEKSELIGRCYFRQLCDTQEWCKINRFSVDKHAHYDLGYYSGGTKIIAEIKVRDYPSTAFNDWLIQEHKYKDLQTLKKQVEAKYPDEDIRIHYVCFFTDGIVRIWDITNLTNQGLTNTLVGKTTKGDTRLVKRTQYLLPNDNAIFKSRYK